MMLAFNGTICRMRAILQLLVIHLSKNRKAIAKNLAFISIVLLLPASFLLSACKEAKTENKEERPFRVASFHPPRDLHPLSGLVGVPLPQLYRHLVWQSPPFSRKPDLLESYSVLNDGRECILHLRRDVHFHDGTLMTAEDVVYTYRRLNKSTQFKLFSFNPVSDSQIEIVDQFTVRVLSKNPQVWDLILTFPILSAKYEKKWEGRNLEDYVPMGSGPYRFVSYDKEQQVMKLERFGRLGNGSTATREIEVHYFPNPEAATMAILEDRVDYIIGLSHEDASYVEKHPDLKVFDRTTPYVYQILLNTRVSRLANEDVRRALSMLIDRKGIVEDRFGLNGGAIATNTALHFSRPFTTPKAHSPNPQKALKLFAKAGWIRKNGRLMRNGQQFRLKILLTKYNNRYLPALRRVVSTWENAGISCKIRYSGLNELLKKGKSGTFEAIFFELPDTPELLASSIYWEGRGTLNFTGFSDPEVDTLYSKLRSGLTISSSAVKEKLQQRITSNTATIVLFYIKAFGAINKRFDLDGAILNDPHGLYYLAEAGQ